VGASRGHEPLPPRQEANGWPTGLVRLCAGVRMQELVELVELLHSHTAAQSHWSSMLTVCFPPGGQRFAPRDALALMEWDLLLAMSRYVCDLYMIPDH
jgi:hypothetical protein